MREWKANCWKRLKPLMHAALKRMEDVDVMKVNLKDLLLDNVWASSIRRLFERDDNQDISSLSDLWS